MAKIFKNVNTIFDKLQRGEIKTTDARVFKTMEYKVRPELVQPYMHHYDARTLSTNVRKFMINENNHERHIAKHFSKKKVDVQKLRQDAMEFYNQDFPKELLSDIFNSYYNDVTKLTFAEQQASNQFRYKMLQNMTDPMSKVITKDSSVKSMVMTRAMAQYFSLLMAYQKQVDEEQFEQMKDQIKQKPNCNKPGQNGQGQAGNQQASGDKGDNDSNNQQQQPGDQGDQDGDQDQDQDQDSGDDSSQPQNEQGNGGHNGSSKNDQDKAPDTSNKSLDDMLKKLEKLMDSKEATKMHDDLIDEAKETIKMIDDLMDDSDMEKDWSSGTDLSGLDKNKLQTVQRQFDEMKMNLGGVKSAVQKLLDRSKNYFSGKEKVNYESILDSDSLDGLEEYMLLHPKLRHVMLDNINVKETTREGKINIYIDISVSMNDHCTLAGSNTRMEKIDFAKAFVMKMKQMGILNKVFLFNGQVHNNNGRIFDIAAIRTEGGTDIRSVVRHANMKKENAIVLTDAEDGLNIYSEYIYFIGVEGCQFQYFDTETMKQYADNNQCIMFDGKSIYNIDQQGRVVGK